MAGRGNLGRAVAVVAALVVVLVMASSAAAKPTVTIDQATGQSDPTPASPIVFTVTFSAPVTGFTATDIDLAGSSAGGALTATVTGGPTDFDVAVSGMTSAGTVVATIPAGAALDLAGNPSLASTSTHNTVTWAPALTGGGAATSAPTDAPLPPKPSLRLLSKCSTKHPCTTLKGGSVLPLRVACGPAAPCVGKVLLAADHRSLGKVDFHLAAGVIKTLRVPLLHRAARLLAGRPKVAAELEIRLGGHSTSRRISLAL